MLMTASKVYVRHPELAAAKANRDFVLRQVCEAVNTISDITQGQGAGQRATGAGGHFVPGAGQLAVALDEFDVMHRILYIYLIILLPPSLVTF
jgi:catenin alpha